MSHKNISFIKSVVRIFGYAFAAKGLFIGWVILVVAEGIGIMEEKYETPKCQTIS
jgi:hypothetical protein